MYKLLIVFILFSCTTIEHIPAERNVAGFDFREFTEKGFFFSPNEYKKDFEPKGLLNFTFFPEANFKFNGNPYKEWVIEPVKFEDIVRMIYDQAIEFGADAVVQLKITPELKTQSLNRHADVIVSGFTVECFLIKRK